MRAGLLNRRVTVQRPVDVRSSSGEVTRTWEDWRTVWASVLPIAGNKFFAADQVQSSVTHTVKVRFQNGYRTNQRIVHEVEPGVSQYMAIEAVLPLRDDKHHLDLMCVLREAEGWR